MKLVVYGSGCKGCHKLHENVLSAIKGMAEMPEVEYVTDMNVLMQKGFMSMPVLEKDGKIISQGKVLKEKDILSLIG